MKITDVEAIVLRQPDVDTPKADGSQDALLIRIHTDAGITGIGEVDSLPPVIKAQKLDEKNGLSINFEERTPDAYTAQFNSGEFKVGGSAALLTVGLADLRGANLNAANLSRVFLVRADLQKADLSHADLSSGHLHDANLAGANLANADLRHANLITAHLRSTHMFRADLRVAKLLGANLADADLRQADLNGADLDKANLAGANFQGAIWTTGSYCGPSPLGECWFGRPPL